MINCALGILAIFLIGISFLGLLLPIDSAKQSNLLLKFLLSIICGIGLWASCYSALILFVGSQPWMIWMKDALLIAVSIRILASKPYAYQWIRAPQFSFPQGAPKWLSIFLILAILSFLSTVFFLSQLMPDGLTDAFSFWNLRARFFFYEGASSTSTFSPDLAWSHIDYPLLLPSLVAQVWLFFGKTYSFIPLIISIFFGGLTLGLVFALVTSKNDRRNGVIAVIVLLTTPFFAMVHSFQYAEPLSGCFILSSFAVLLLTWSLSLREFHRGILLSGLLASFAAWTKNEGILQMLVIALIIPLMRQGDMNSRLKALGHFVLGALPVSLLLIYFKTHQGALGTPVFVLDPKEIQTQLTDPQRLSLMIKELSGKLVLFKRWNFFLIAVPLTLWIFRKNLVSSKVLMSILIASLLSFIGFCVILILGRYDLKWQIDVSLDRLIYQVWPAIIVVTFIAMKGSENPALSASHSK
jgi:hypothetical protein